MNNYVFIWGDWLSCDPLRWYPITPYKETLVPHLVATLIYLSQIYSYYIRGDRSPLRNKDIMGLGPSIVFYDQEWLSLSKWYAWRLTFVGRLWHLSLVIMILLWHLSLAVTFVEAKLRHLSLAVTSVETKLWHLSLAVTFVKAKLWHLSLAVTFVEAMLWHLSLAVTFVEAKLWHLPLAVTFVEAMLWHLSLAVTFVEGCCDICRGLWYLVGLWHLSAQQAIDTKKTSKVWNFPVF